MQHLISLLRVAIGVQKQLERPFSREEWQQLLNEAQKQAVLGLVWCAISKLPHEAQPCLEDRLDWMHYANTIVKHNEHLEKVYGDVTKLLAKDGIQSCIFKGQTLTKIWPNELRAFRQCGDVDVWTTCGAKRVIEWGKKHEQNARITPKHVSIHYDGEEVEIHYAPVAVWNADKPSVQLRFCQDQVAKWQYDEEGGYFFPEVPFDRFFTLLHAYRHFLKLGIGYKYLVDLYFLCKWPISEAEKADLSRLIDACEMRKFAGAMMWVLHEVFDLEKEHFWCEENEREGKFVLEQLTEIGNFGNLDKKKGLFALKMARHYPKSVLRMLPQKIKSLLWLMGK